MKITKAGKWMVMGAVALTIVGCSKDNDEPIDEGTKVDLPAHRMYILNEGNWNMNNAGIAFYAPSNPETEMIDNIFFEQNGRLLGDNGQAMIERNGKIYVAVSGSNYIAKLNEACVEESRVSFVNDAALQGGVRAITEHNGYLYATFYGGVVVKIDTATMEIKDRMQTSGSNLEGITVQGDEIYVANAYKISVVDGQNVYSYLPEVLLIDINTFKEEGKITVSPNPNLLMSKDDKVFLISWTNYFDSEYCFQVIDPKNNNSVTPICKATHFASGNGKVYLGYSETDWSTWTATNTFSTYDIATGTYSTESFLKDAPQELLSGNLYMMAIDPKGGDIYIGITNYAAANGDIYRFDSTGNYVGKIDSGGQNPRAAVFVNK